MIRRLMFAAAAIGLPPALPIGGLRRRSDRQRPYAEHLPQLRANSYGQLRQGNRCLSTDGGKPQRQGPGDGKPSRTSVTELRSTQG